MKRFLLALATALSVHAGTWAADSVDDYVYLASKGIGDEVLLARLDTQGISGALSTADIVRLKEARVSDRVIAALIRRGAAVSPRVDGTESNYASTATEPVIGRPAASVTPTQPVVRERVIEVQRTVPVYTAAVYSTPVYSSPVVYASYGYYGRPYYSSYCGRPYYSNCYYPRYYGGYRHYGHHYHGGFGFRAGFRF